MSIKKDLLFFSIIRIICKLMSNDDFSHLNKSLFLSLSCVRARIERTKRGEEEEESMLISLSRTEREKTMRDGQCS